MPTGSRAKVSWFGRAEIKVNKQNTNRSFAATGAVEGLQVNVSLNDDELAAVEGWRVSNNLPSMADAVRELVRLGLLSEISKVHGIVSAVRDSVKRQDPSFD